MALDISNLGRAGDYPAFRFAKAGDTVTGTIVDEPKIVTVKQDDGTVKDSMILNVAIADGTVSHRKAANPDGTVTLAPVDTSTTPIFAVWVGVQSRMFDAVKDAVGKADALLDKAGVIAIRLTGYGEPTKPGWSAPGLYTAKYTAPPPQAVRSVNDLF